FGRRLLPVADGADLGPDQGPIDLVEVEQRQATVIAGGLQVAIEQAPPVVRPAALLEVHDQEGDFAEDIDPAQLGGKLDAVEDMQFPIDPGDVAEMQVAVAFADPAGARAADKQSVQLAETLAAPAFQLVEAAGMAGVGEQGTELVEILGHRCPDGLRGAEGGAGRSAGDPS